MPFSPGVYRNNIRKPMLFPSCGKCGKEFEQNEKIWKKAKGVNNYAEVSCRIVAYLCQKCYDALFIDV